MSRKFRVLKDLQAKGLEADKTSIIDSQWEVISNMAIEGGSWKKRPGWKRLVPDLPAATTQAKCKVITEFTHNALVQDATEDLNPNAEGGQSQWVRSGGSSNYLLVDDGTTHDADVTYLYRPETFFNAGVTNQDWRFSVKFPTPSTTYSKISSISLWLTMRKLGQVVIGPSTLSNLRPTVQGYWRDPAGGPASFIGGGAVWTNNYIEYGFQQESNLSMGRPWTMADLTTPEFAIVYRNSINATIPGSFASCRVTRARLTITGIDSASVRTRSKIYVSNTDWLRLKEDLSAFEDIDSGNAAIVSTGENVIWDWAFFNQKVFFTNGVDDIAFYPASGSDIMDTIGGSKPVGRCLGSYAARLFQGDVVDSATRTKYRVVWCKINDATDWTDPESAGNLDLDETPGAIVAMTNFTEARDQTFIGVLVVFKEDSIFHIEATGVSTDPFDKRVMNANVGLVARHTLGKYTKPDGTQVIAFLGTDGGKLNVLEWNGDAAVPIGDPIMDTLINGVSHADIDKAWAVVDPTTYTYILGLAGSFGGVPISAISDTDDDVVCADPLASNCPTEGDVEQGPIPPGPIDWPPRPQFLDIIPGTAEGVTPPGESGSSSSFAFVYDITNGSWSTWAYTPIDAVGLWRIGDRWATIGGRQDSLPYELATNVISDEVRGTTDILPIVSELRTGALHLAEEPLKRSILYRVWIYHKALQSKATWTVRVSTDNFRTFDQQEVKTSNHWEGQIEILQVDFQSEGRLHGVSIVSDQPGEQMQIERIVLEYEEQDTDV